MQPRRPSFVLFPLLLLAANITLTTANCTCSSLDRNVIIRDQRSLWVVDGNWGGAVKFIRYKVGHTDQRWLFQPSSRVGLFNLICATTGQALDIDNLYDQDFDSYNATVHDLTDSLSQQWFIDSDGSIVSAYAMSHVLHPYGNNYTEENYLVLTPKRSDTSRFFLDFATEDEEGDQ